MYQLHQLWGWAPRASNTSVKKKWGIYRRKKIKQLKAEKDKMKAENLQNFRSPRSFPWFFCISSKTARREKKYKSQNKLLMYSILQVHYGWGHNSQPYLCTPQS